VVVEAAAAAVVVVVVVVTPLDLVGIMTLDTILEEENMEDVSTVVSGETAIHSK